MRPKELNLLSSKRGLGHSWQAPEISEGRQLFIDGVMRPGGKKTLRQIQSGSQGTALAVRVGSQLTKEHGGSSAA